MTSICDNIVLRILNPEKNIEEDVGVVNFTPSLPQVIAGLEKHISNTNNKKVVFESVTVSGYSKDEALLSRKNGQPDTVMTFPNESDRKKLIGFARYLNDRKKAGILKFDGFLLYLLPPGSMENCIHCYSVELNQIQASTAPTSSSSLKFESTKEILNSNRPTSSTISTLTKPASQLKQQQPVPQESNFMSSLMNKARLLNSLN